MVTMLQEALDRKDYLLCARLTRTAKLGESFASRVLNSFCFVLIDVTQENEALVCELFGFLQEWSF